MQKVEERALVVDGQLFQTPAWHRGMGKYSLEFLGALATLNKDKHYWSSIYVLLSDGMPSDKAMLAAVKNAVKGAKIKILPLRPNVIGDKSVVAHNRKVCNAFVGSLLDGHKSNQIDYLILSLLQGEIFPAFPTLSRVRNTLLYYDLIPLMFHRIYLGNPITRNEYFSKFSELFRADQYLSISKTGANDLALYLGVEPGRILNIDGGPINHNRDKKETNLSILKPFILMPTGNDLRKNNRRGIAGFAEFNARHNNKYSLVITSSFKDFEIQELSKLCPDVIFTGNIPGEELNFLFEHAEALLFPTEYEGLGLPILEAVEKNKPIACSDITVFREMSRTDFAFFDPKRIAEIANALEYVTAEDYSVNKDSYRNILKRYTWRNTARLAAKGLLSDEPRSSIDKSAKLKLAVFAPDPAHDFSAGKHVLDAHSALTRLFDVDYFLEARKAPDTPRVNFLPFITKVTDTSRHIGIDLDGYDQVVFNITNTTDSAMAIFTALAHPGVVILHSLGLEIAWGAMKSRGLIDEQRYKLEERLDTEIGTGERQFLVSLIARQKAIVVHNEDAKTKIQKLLSNAEKETPIYVIPLSASSLVHHEILPAVNERVGLVLGDFAPKSPVWEEYHGIYQKEVIMSVYNENQTYEDTVANPTDYEYMETLSKLSYIVDNSNLIGGSCNLAFSIVEAMKFGAVPVVSESCELPGDTVIRLGKHQSLDTLSALPLNDHNKLRESAKSYAKSLTFDKFASQLYGALTAVQQAENEK